HHSLLVLNTFEFFDHMGRLEAKHTDCFSRHSSGRRTRLTDSRSRLVRFRPTKYYESDQPSYFPPLMRLSRFAFLIACERLGRRRKFAKDPLRKPDLHGG